MKDKKQINPEVSQIIDCIISIGAEIHKINSVLKYKLQERKEFVRDLRNECLYWKIIPHGVSYNELAADRAKYYDLMDNIHGIIKRSCGVNNWGWENSCNDTANLLEAMYRIDCHISEQKKQQRELDTKRDEYIERWESIDTAKTR